ncbi:heterogeneous nuclear ribonucleoprotein 1-like [Coffea eugenioides]|uniref:heterogeneous nuclear ribonucleoprotein 1-like n=1 Tax=Coffea eugenioides TaxID=49369 RepID=UPI000F607EB3|nr:heterogeneous nuclear ribonucleoprotein 1-like [Coffea eugenioides]
MDSSVSDEGKLFVGGIAWDTEENRLKDYFNKYGEVTHAAIMRDKATGQPRGFGFVVFSDPSILDSVLRDKHTVDGRTVEVKRALSRAKQQSLRSGDSNANSSRNYGGLGNYRTKKIFVGGLPSTLTEGEFVQYFENYGDIADAVIMFDQSTGRSRGFGFITFDAEDAVDRVLNKTFHELNNKLVEVKKALPKEFNPVYAAHGRNFNAYGSYSANAFNSQMDSSRFLQPQPAAGGYPPYSSFGAPSFGYGLANTNAFYGGFGAYAFGSSIAGYSGSALAYGNQTATSTGYASSTADLRKGQWGSQSIGHGALGYSLNPGYGFTVPWNTPGGAASLGRSPRGTANSGTSSYRGVEYPFTDSGKHQTLNKHRGSIKKNRNAGQNSAETGHHEASGGFKGRTYDSSDGASQYPDGT